MIYGAVAVDEVGFSVASAGDVNGDGYNDIIIGAALASPNSRSQAGESYVIYGSANNPETIDLAVTLSNTQGFVIYGGEAGDKSGYSVNGAGDVNGDGYDDVIIGAPYANPNSKPDAGVSYVIYGSANNPGTIDLSVALTSTQGFVVYGANAGSYSDHSGWSVSGAGDVNSDGYSDVIIGASSASPGSRTYAGASYVIYGSANNPGTIDLLVTLTSTQGFVIYGGNQGDYSGWSVSGAGDVNRDGHADIVIGAQSASPSSRSNAGESYVIYGSTSNPGIIDLLALSNAQGFAIYGGAASDRSGRAVSSAGDINKDGYADIIIGAPYANPSSRPDAGKSYIIYGSLSNPSVIDLANLGSSQVFDTFLGGTANDNSGYSVSAAGDINGDGYDDIIIGACYASPNSKQLAGESYVVYGSAISTLSPTLKPTAAPTMMPTSIPTSLPTQNPTISPTLFPTQVPTMQPTSMPTTPTFTPTIVPTFVPSVIPTKLPTVDPTTRPTVTPTIEPTSHPTNVPTLFPTQNPTTLPTLLPTQDPTVEPSAIPTTPTFMPTTLPTVDPTAKPTENPTVIPTLAPSKPTLVPTTSPSSCPTITPTSLPTEEPIEFPTLSPTVVEIPESNNSIDEAISTGVIAGVAIGGIVALSIGVAIYAKLYNLWPFISRGDTLIKGAEFNDVTKITVYAGESAMVDDGLL